jgi:hypothetical protein
MKALRRGWYLGEATFGDRLLDMLKKPAVKKNRASEAPKEHGEAEAERFAGQALPRLGLPEAPKELATLGRGDVSKVLVASLAIRIWQESLNESSRSPRGGPLQDYKSVSKLACFNAN